MDWYSCLVSYSATIAGASAGLVLLGPLAALFFGVAANYASKADNEAGEVARGVGKTLLDVWNYLAKINEKYNIGEKVGETTKELYTKVKESDGDDGAVAKVEEVSDIPVVIDEEISLS